MLLAHFWEASGWGSDPSYSKHICKNIVNWLNEIGWALELLEHREPELTHGGEALRMNWGNWFEVLNFELRVAAQVCPTPSLRHFVSCLITLRTQCDPENSCFLTQSEALEEADLLIEEIREQQRDRRRRRLSS